MPERFSNSEGEDFLKEKYPDLPKSPEVESAVKRQEIKSGEKAKNDPKEKIGAYLDRLNEIFNPEDTDKKERRVDILKDKLHDKFVIKEIPESYFKQQQKIAREQGHGDIEITNQLREEALKTISANQEQSLDAWVDYLSSEDATYYPDWLKYWAFRSITGLSQYDKEAHEFKKRSKSTTAPFPDINREALAYVLDAVEKQQKEKKEKKKNEIEPQQPADEEWEKLLKTQNFGKLYAHAIEKITPASEEEKESIQGEWIRYDQSDDPEDAKPLYESLQGYGTGWCTAGESMATAQLEAGDFYIFYTKDKQGLNKIPRVAIRMEHYEIAEARGIGVNQNLEPIMADVAKEKISKLGGGEKYEKRVSDMKKLTEIEKKFSGIIKTEKEIIQAAKDTDMLAENTNMLVEIESSINPDADDTDVVNNKLKELYSKLKEIRRNYQDLELTKEELRFLYELDSRIEGFGYGEDPRIEELKEKRNKLKDYVFIFDCKNEREIATEGRITQEKTVLVGDLSFHKTKLKNTKNLKHITGNADFHKLAMEDFPSLESIEGEVMFRGSKTKSLGQLKKIGISANFIDSEVVDLGQLESIGGAAVFKNSKLKNLGKLKSIGGIVYTDKDSELDFSKVKIGGKIVRE